ncbi:unnamed protein product [Calypogeia fissa]
MTRDFGARAAQLWDGKSFTGRTAWELDSTGVTPLGQLQTPESSLSLVYSSTVLQSSACWIGSGAPVVGRHTCGSGDWRPVAFHSSAKFLRLLSREGGRTGPPHSYTSSSATSPPTVVRRGSIN